MTSVVAIDGQDVVVSPAGARTLRTAHDGVVHWGEMHPAARDRLVTTGLIVELPGRLVGLTDAGREALRQILHE